MHNRYLKSFFADRREYVAAVETMAAIDSEISRTVARATPSELSGVGASIIPLAVDVVRLADDDRARTVAETLESLAEVWRRIDEAIDVTPVGCYTADGRALRARLVHLRGKCARAVALAAHYLSLREETRAAGCATPQASV